MFELRYVYNIPNDRKEGNLASSPEGPLYRVMMAANSLNTPEPLILRGLQLPLHISSDRRVYDRQLLDPTVINICDRWKYVELYVVVSHDSPRVEAYLQNAPKNAAKNAAGAVLLSVSKF
jgi:hypothetical protein